MESPKANKIVSRQSNSRPEKSDAEAKRSAERFANEHSSCAMCESTLDVRHEIDRNELKIREEAHCPSCGIRVRSGHHLMH